MTRSVPALVLRDARSDTNRDAAEIGNPNLIAGIFTPAE